MMKGWSSSDARIMMWSWMLLVVIATMIPFERTTATSSAFCSTSSYGSSSLGFLRQQRQQQPCSNRMRPSFVVTRGGGNDNTSGSSQLESSSSSLSTNQAEFQHLIVDFTEEQVDALMDYSQECAEFNGEGQERPTYQFESLRKQLQDVYDEYGVVLVRGLLKKPMLSKLVEAGNYLVEKEKMEFEADSFRSIKFGPVFGGASVEQVEEESDSDDQLLATFRQVALKSAVPACIALLMNLDTSDKKNDESSSNELRLLNDVFLAKGSSDKSFCGWHIDDAVFWPCQPTTPSDSSKDGVFSSDRPAGINAWIAMDDILAEYGGSMAVIPKSHTSEWATEAQHVIGHTTTHPPEGFTALPQLFQTITKTCAIADNAPDLNKKMESDGILFDFQKGDVLLMNRYLWHRSVMLSPEGKQYYLSKQQKLEDGDDDDDEDEISLKRYTIRYEVGNAPLIKGISIHPSILFDSKNSGQTLSDVVHRSGPFFPKCWPTIDKDEMFQIKELVDEKLPKAEQVKFEMFMKMKQQQSQTEAMSSSSSSDSTT